MSSPVRPLALLAAVVLVAACGNGDVVIEPLPVIDQAVGAETLPPTSVTATSTTMSSSTTTSSTTTSSTTTSSTTASSTTSTTTTTTTTSPPAVYLEQDYTPMTTVGGITLTHPAARVEYIGFHQSGHDGSQGQAIIDGSAPSSVLGDRGRNTSLTGAADVVVDPTAEIRSPVTGVVIRAGGYILYCDHEDHFVVIEPDERPGWEVKVFHMEGLLVEVGDRVEAGVTPISPNSRRLPFVSQVDEFTAEPSNPHVHIEVVDPSIPDIPSGSGGGC